MGFFRDEQGFTTVGIAVSILLAIALLFSCAHVYEVNSCTAEIQEVADASALAAASVTAEFMVATALCDAVVLSLTLTSLLCGGVGTIALCVPGGQTIGGKLVDASGNVLSARNSFAERVAQGLNHLQEALPFLCALNAAAVAAANNNESHRYVAIAIPVPLEGEPIVVGASAACNAYTDAVQQNADYLAQQAVCAEEAANDANEAKLRGFFADCGANPEYCMYQRADTVGGLPAAKNPIYHSADTWSFSVALQRARAYYTHRALNESSSGSSVEQQANAELRRVFYRYAAQRLQEGYVNDTDTSFTAYFPLMYSKTAELRESDLYTQLLFPITDNGEQTMHAFEGCPCAEGWQRRGSVAQLEAGGFTTCSVCRFKASDLGDVASASSRISNGFEYHYRLVAQAAEDYQRARAQATPAFQEAKGTVSSLLNALKDALVEGANYRIASTRPPGARGCAVFVVNMATGALPTRFSNPFASMEAQLGLRVAVSGALLQEDGATDGATVVNSLLDRVDTSSALAGAGKMILDCWSGLLFAYGSGQASLLDGVEGMLSGIPLANSSGLGSWARGQLEQTIEAAGLQPANLSAMKPVLASAGAVTQGDQGAFSVRFQQLRQQALRGSAPSGNLFDGIVNVIGESAFDALNQAEEGVVVASFVVPVVEVEVPITIALPPSVAHGARNWVQGAVELLQGLAVGGSSRRAWQ